MTARTLFALFCVLAAAQGAPLSPDLAPPSVGVILEFDHPPGWGFRRQMEREVGDIFRPAGLDLHWEVVRKGQRHGDYSRAVVVEMRGYCSALRSSAARSDAPVKMPLGWTIVNDGEVIPFAVVDCDRIALATGSAPEGVLSQHALSPLYGRLAGRVLAHELMHALLRTAEHHGSDATRPMLRWGDVRAVARLEPEEIRALRKIGHEAPPALAQSEAPGSAPGRHGAARGAATSGPFR